MARAAAGPLLLAVEDVHWAGPAALEDLAGFAGEVATAPVLLVLTTRRENDPIDASWRARAGLSSLTTIDLGPLPESDARTFAAQVLADATAPALERCLARAQGHPLFLEQLLRHVQEERDDAIPGSVHSLVQARLDSLAAADRDALRAASVLG